MMEGKNDPPPSYEQGYTTTQTTTTTTTSATPSEGIHVNKVYPKSIPGILKIIQIVLCLVCLIIVGFMWSGAGGWGGFCAGTGFFCSLIWFILYLLNINTKFHPVMFIIELVYYCVLCVFFLIAGIVAAATVHGNGAHIAFAIFGFCASIAFGIDAFFQFQRYRAGSFQSQHTTTTTTSEVRY